MPPQKRVLFTTLAGLGLAAALIPTGVGAYKLWRDSTHRMQLSDFAKTDDRESPYVLTPRASEELEEEGEGEEGESELDDALMRQMAARNYYGETTPEATEALARVTQREAARWAALMPKSLAALSERERLQSASALKTPGKTWVNLGPTDARYQFNGTEYLQVDSGRTTGFAVNPADVNIAYTSTSGGGVWKTFNFGEKNPTWYPITETTGTLAVGAFAMDPTAPETLYAGLGDFADTPSGHIIKSTNGGVSWSAPVRLAGTYPSPLDFPVQANSVRAIAVDPAQPLTVLVGTDVGLFRSVDGGASFSLVDLPNGASQNIDAVWTIIYAGTVSGVTRWALSGVGGWGDIWTSSDAGATWSSRAAAGGLPATNVVRIDMGGGTPAADGTTVIYAQVAAADTTTGTGIWRSADSGATFVSALGTLRNPTTTSTNCRSQHVQTGQAWYDQAVAVDPANNNNVILGGSLCAVRSLNALAASPVWELVSHWLPSGNGGQTVDGRLPYVHADWHLLKVIRPASGGYITIAGTDGGLFVSRNVFTTSLPTDRFIRWDYPNRGIVSHLFYSIASGDEVTGNPFVAYGGLQDNGTRFRDSPQFPTTFNQVVGGDGLGASASSAPGDRVYWGSVQNGALRLCDPDTLDCNRGESWFGYKPQDDFPTLPCSGDGVANQFYTRVQALRTTTAETGPAVLTITDKGVWRFVEDPFFSTKSWQLLGDPAAAADTGACSSGVHRNLFASAVSDGLYGVATSGGRFRITSNCSLTTPPNQCTWTRSNPLGADVNNNGTLENEEKVLSTASIDFPPGPTGKTLGDVYVAASVALTTSAGLPVPDALGHLFITQDRGQTWQTLKGNGTSDLPNAPVEVVRYDPSDTTNQTLYVGNYVGVYRTTDGGQTWQRFGEGMPMVRVSDLFLSSTGAFVRAASYGRGLWEIYPSATAEKGVNGNGDWDRNLQIDFQDILATSSRLGTSPATTEAPFYEWNQDMTGQVNGIDDADLAALLQHLGGRP